MNTEEYAKEFLNRGLIDQARYDQVISALKPKKEAPQAPEAPTGVEALKQQQANRKKGLSKVAGLSDEQLVNSVSPQEAQMLADPSSIVEPEAEAPAQQQTLAQPQAGGMQPMNASFQPAPTLASDVAGQPVQTQPMMGMGLTQASTPGIDLQQQAIAEGAAAGASKAAEESAYYQNMQKNLNEQNRALADFQAEEQARIQEKQNELETKIAEVNQMSVDPNRYWASQDTANKIGMGISLVLGAFGAASNGVNRAAQVIDNAINRDIRLQESEIASARQGLQQQKGLLADMKSSFKDNVMAKQAAIASYLQQSQLKVQEIAARHNAPQVRANAAQLIGQLEEKKQAASQKFMQEAMKRMPVSAASNPEFLTPDQRERFIPGYGLVQSKSDASYLRKEILPTYNAISDNLDALISLAENGNSTNLEDRDRASVIKQMLVGQLRLPILGPGTVQQFERDLMNDLIANPTDIFSISSRNKTKLKELKRVLENDKSNKLKPFGIKTTGNNIGFKPLAGR